MKIKKVYESSTALESHMVKNLLENEEIDSQIDGEYLQGGVGDLQAIGVIRVMVEEVDYDKAKDIITKWEAIQPDPEETRSTKTSSSANGFALGVALTLGSIYLIFSSPVTQEGIDFNGDGILDEVWTYKNSRLQKTTVDRNLDGKNDAIYSYDNKVMLETGKFDDDFDGIFESTVTYKNGVTVKEETDTNKNEIIDYRASYKNDILEYVELIDEASGLIRKRKNYKLNKLISDDYDTNGDGVLNSHYEYDQYEEKK